MTTSFWQVLTALVLGIAVIVLLTARYRIHAFFALLIACALVGVLVGMPAETIIDTAKEGFGAIMKSLALVIVLGTCLGRVLETTGGTEALANAIVNKLGAKRSALAINLTGFLVGLPIFCDSGYIVLSGLNNSLSAKTRIPMAVMAGSLATGLYAVHCLVPPHPGATAAAGILQVATGTLLLYGALIALPVSIAGWLWVQKAGRKYSNASAAEPTKPVTDRPPLFFALAPVLVPILLIALHSILPANTPLRFIGDPVVALSIGILLAIPGKRHWTRAAFGHVLQDAAEKAGGILVIIGAGGAFGAILAKTNLGLHLGEQLHLSGWGIAFPFLLTALLKTAQGSSTVAIITAASIVAPLLSNLGMADGDGPLFAVLAMGAGSMMISHANDAYFWVIAKFSGLDTKAMLGTYTMASICMGLTAFVIIGALWWLKQGIH